MTLRAALSAKLASRSPAEVAELERTWNRCKLTITVLQAPLFLALTYSPLVLLVKRPVDSHRIAFAKFLQAGIHISLVNSCMLNSSIGVGRNWLDQTRANLAP